MNNFFRITGIVLGLLILVSCSKRNQEEGSWSHFMGLVDTVTVRDTILKVDTLIVDKEIILRDTVKVEKRIVFRDTVLIEKEVVKRVEVPADIPEEYKIALERFRAENFATSATDATIFSGMDRLNVRIQLNEDAKEIISEQRVRDKFELLLRGYGIPVLSLDYMDLTRFSGQLISFRERSPKWEEKDHIQQHFVSKWSRWSDRVVVPTI